jgi:hypothetical protein
MKIINKIILILIGGLLTFSASAQTNPLDEMIKIYADEPGFYFMEMKTNMLSSFSKDEASHSTGKIISIKMLSFKDEGSSQYNAEKIYEQFNSSVKSDAYRGLVTIKSSGDKLEMMVKKEGVQLSEIIVIVRENKEVTFIAASGSFDLKDIAKFSELKSCSGLETLQKLCEE